MSRSIRGGKGPGYEYWSKRPFSGVGPSKENKQITHKIERQRNKQLDKAERD